MGIPIYFGFTFSLASSHILEGTCKLGSPEIPRRLGLLIELLLGSDPRQKGPRTGVAGPEGLDTLK